MSISGQALIFVTRSQRWSFLERPHPLLLSAFVIAQVRSRAPSHATAPGSIVYDRGLIRCVRIFGFSNCHGGPQLVATFIGVYGFNGYPGYDASAAPGELIWDRASFVGAGWAYAALACT